MGFDFDAIERWARRLEPKGTLARRSEEELPFIDDDSPAGQALLLDTCVYIDQMQDRTPQTLDNLIATRQINHSTVAIQELMHTIGTLNSSDTRTPNVIAEIRKQIVAMPAHRILTPDTEVLGKAAVLSGMLCRFQHYQHDRKLRALHDCILFLQAQKHGLVALTANINDFDILLQLIPNGRVLFYRKVP